MKKRNLSVIVLMGLAAACACAAGKGPQKDNRGEWVYDTFTFEAKTGDWALARNWKGGTPPSGELARVNILGGRTVTLNTPVAFPLAILCMGLSQKAVFYFDRDAKLAVGRVNIPHAYEPGTTAEFHMRGGELTVGDLKAKDHNQFLNVGTNATFSGGGRFVISGGTLSAGLRVGNDTPGTNTGAFCVQGSLPHIGSRPKSFFGTAEVLRSGALEFVLDEKGVAPLNFAGCIVTLHDGALLRVDGAAYRGKPHEMPLIIAGSLKANGNIRTEAVGFPADWRAQIVLEKTGAKLKFSP